LGLPLHPGKGQNHHAADCEGCPWQLVHLFRYDLSLLLRAEPPADAVIIRMLRCGIARVSSFCWAIVRRLYEVISQINAQKPSESLEIRVGRISKFFYTEPTQAKIVKNILYFSVI